MKPDTTTGPLDADGAPIVAGARVVQINAFDSGKGALQAHCRLTGTVVSVGRARARVAFDGVTKIYAFRPTDEPATHDVHGAFLRVVPDGTEPYCGVPDGADGADWTRRLSGRRTAS